MLDILTASPTPGAYRVSPMTTAEIDAHPDRDRIWATVAAMQAANAEAYDEGYGDADEKNAGAVDEAEDGAWGECEQIVDRAVRKLLDQADAMTKDDLISAIDDIGGCLS